MGDHVGILGVVLFLSFSFSNHAQNPLAQCEKGVEHIKKCLNLTHFSSFDSISESRKQCSITLEKRTDSMDGGLKHQRESMDVFNMNCDEIRKEIDRSSLENKRENKTSRVLCRLGFNFACPEMKCPAHAAIPTPDKNDPCIEYLRYDDCNACEYYRCKEKTYKCGESGYLLGYVGKYCHRFSTITTYKTSPKAQDWLKKTRECLIREFEVSTNESMSCERVHQIGTDSHANCYVDSGFCELNVKDWFDIVHTIDRGDIPFQQLFTTGNSCLSRWIGL